MDSNNTRDNITIAEEEEDMSCLSQPMHDELDIGDHLVCSIYFIGNGMVLYDKNLLNNNVQATAAFSCG